MLTIGKFKARLIRPNHPDWLLVGVDTKDDSRLYILGNGGMSNINCAPIESFPEEIKNYAIEMVTQGELYLKGNEKSLRIGQGKSIYSYTLKQIENLLPTSSTTRKIYFSSIFIRWQRSHQLSDEHVQEKLGLTAKEFHQFREDELTITPDLIKKLVEITGVSEQFWKNREDQKNKGFRGGIMKTFKTVTMQKVTTLVCDGCGLEVNADGGYEFQEFISINHYCGYGSIHGDGKKIDIDLCQQCFADMCGDTLRATDESNKLTQEEKAVRRIRLNVAIFLMRFTNQKLKHVS